MESKINTTNKRLSRVKDLLKSNEDTESLIQSRKYAKDDEINILITGENGTGKELHARYIHKHSPRADKPFLTSNIAALPENLLQSELFGHVKGAFTGAVNNKEGIFRAANGGTVFLDEIGDASPLIQVALLRFLDYGEIQTVGKDIPDIVNVRVIAATNVNLQEKIDNKLFREDLYYRLAGATIHLEPLRLKPIQEKREILNRLIFNIAEHKGKDAIQLTESAWELFLAHKFKGNYRDARNIIEQLYIEDKRIIDEQDIIKLISNKTAFDYSGDFKHVDNNNIPAFNRPLELKEQAAIIVFDTLQKHNGVKKEALKELNISFKTLNTYLSIYESINNSPNGIGNIPTSNWNNSNTIIQKR